MATLLPNGESQFFDANGNPLAMGTVGFYVPNTLTPKDTWQDSGAATLNINPVELDAAGRAIIYGSGIYRQIVKDQDGNTIWDQLTADTAAGGVGWGGVSTGIANAQIIAPSNFTEQDGQQISFIAGLSNTSQLTVNGIAVLQDTGTGPQPLAGGEVVENNAVTLIYEAARGAFHIVNPVDSAAQMTYTVDATGGVQRTVASRLNDYLSAFDFLSEAQRTAVIAGTLIAGLGTALNAAYAAAMASKRKLLINRGTWLVDPFEASGNLAFGFYLNAMIDVEGEGIDQTILRNINSSSAFIRCAGGFAHKFGNLTLDQNNSIGNAFQQGGQGSATRDLKIVNQIGAGWAIVIDGTTYITLDNVIVSNCARGMDLGATSPTQYVTAKGVRVESDADAPNTAQNVRMKNVASSVFDGLYVDSGDAPSGSHAGIITMQGCEGISFLGLTCELAGRGNLSAGAVTFDGCKGVTFDGGRAYISADYPTGKAVFAMTGDPSDGISISSFYWRNEKDGSYFLFQDTVTATTTQPGIFTVDTVTVLNTGASVYGVFIEARALMTADVVISNMRVIGGNDITHRIGALRIALQNSNYDTEVLAGSGGTFINYSATLSGAGAGSIIQP